MSPLDLPVRFGLKLTVILRRPRKRIVDKHHAMTDENTVFNCHPFTNERMTGYLAVPSNRRILLDLNKRADFRVIAYTATVKVDEVREFHVFPQYNAGRNADQRWVLS